MFTFYNSVLFAPLKWRQTAHSLFLSHSLSFSFSRSKVKWGIESTRRWRTGKTLKQPTHGMAKTQIPMSIKWNLLFFKNLEQWIVRRSFFIEIDEILSISCVLYDFGRKYRTVWEMVISVLLCMDVCVYVYMCALLWTN